MTLFKNVFRSTAKALQRPFGRFNACSVHFELVTPPSTLPSNSSPAQPRLGVNPPYSPPITQAQAQRPSRRPRRSIVDLLPDAIAKRSPPPIEPTSECNTIAGNSLVFSESDEDLLRLPAILASESLNLEELASAIQHDTSQRHLEQARRKVRQLKCTFLYLLSLTVSEFALI
jgi:hypothetical protein